MGTVGVDTEKAAAVCAAFTTGGKELDDLSARVSSLQGPLLECWEGLDGEACVEYLTKLSSKMGEMSVEVEKIRKWTDDISQGWEESATKRAQRYQV